jgi:hypothetical protein
MHAQRYGSEFYTTIKDNDGMLFVIASVLRMRTEGWEKRYCFRSHDQEIRIIPRIRLVRYCPPFLLHVTLGLDPSIIGRRCVIIVNFGKCTYVDNR